MDNTKSTRNIRATKTYSIIITAFFAALTAVCSQIAIPIGPVPINLALFSVFTAAGLLGLAKGTISQVVYVLLGAVGVPVFAGFKGGIGALVGPTGGYIIGYIFAALVTSLIFWLFRNKFSSAKVVVRVLISVLAMVAGLFICYAFGTAWFLISSGVPFAKAMMACVIPFLPGDAVKIAVATLLTIRLKKYV